MSGLSPLDGVAAGNAQIAGGISVAPESVVGTCAALYHKNGCKAPNDRVAWNYLIANWMTVLNDVDLPHDCTDEEELLKMLRAVVLKYTPPVVIPPIPSEVLCRSQLAAGAFPPATNVAKILVDDSVDPPKLWVWDCDSGEYKLPAVADGGSGLFFWDSVFEPAGFNSGQILNAPNQTITVPLNLTYNDLPGTPGLQIGVRMVTAGALYFSAQIVLRNNPSVIVSQVSGLSSNLKTGAGGLTQPAGSLITATAALTPLAVYHAWDTVTAPASTTFPLRQIYNIPLPSPVYAGNEPLDIIVKLDSLQGGASGQLLGVAIFDTAGAVWGIPTAPPPSTCFPAGSLVRMADGSSKPIEEVAVGDLVYSPKLGADIVSDAHPTTLGSRKLFRMDDDSIRWSEEHSFWIERAGEQRLWSMNVELLIEEARRGDIIGLSDWDWPFEGVPNTPENFARDDGSFVPKTPVRVRGADPSETLYFVETRGGGLISVNGYIVGAGLDESAFDYKAFKHGKAAAKK